MVTERVAHTPGDWKWFDYPDGRKLLCAPSKAVIHCPDAPITISPSDQALIAAAPDLYAVLKESVEHMEAELRAGAELATDTRVRFEAARAAVAKAEGRS